MPFSKYYLSHRLISFDWKQSTFTNCPNGLVIVIILKCDYIQIYTSVYNVALGSDGPGWNPNRINTTRMKAHNYIAECILHRVCLDFCSVSVFRNVLILARSLWLRWSNIFEDNQWQRQPHKHEEGGITDLRGNINHLFVLKLIWADWSLYSSNACSDYDLKDSQ